MSKKMLLVQLLAAVVLSLVSGTVFAGENPDTTLYIKGLEALVKDSSDLAENSFSELVEAYPKSSYYSKASEYLSDIRNTVDNSGIVSLYITNLAVSTYTMVMLPGVFDFDGGPIMYGLTGLAGVGLGIGSSILMSENYPITSGLDWWIESSQLIANGNYLYLNGIIDMEDFFGEYAGNAFLAGQLLTTNASRYGTYFALRGKPVSAGKASFMLQSYLWANAYYWLGTILLDSTDLKTNATVGLAVTDTVLLGSLPLWDTLQWSPMRSGLVSVGGLGGALVGWFSTMILEEVLSFDTKTYVGMIMASTALGQAAGVYLTSGMENEHTLMARAGSTDTKASQISWAPLVTPDSVGAMVLCRL